MWRRFVNCQRLDYRTLQVALTEKLPNVAGAGLIELGATVAQVIDAIFGKLVQGSAGVSGCPKSSYTDLHTQTQFFGVRQQPGAIY